MRLNTYVLTLNGKLDFFHSGSAQRQAFLIRRRANKTISQNLILIVVHRLPSNFSNRRECAGDIPLHASRVAFTDDANPAALFGDVLITHTIQALLEFLTALLPPNTKCVWQINQARRNPTARLNHALF